MKLTYYPGCTLRTKAKDLDRYTRLSAEKLGLELVEPEEWQCCGGAYSNAKDEIANKLSAVRAILDADSTTGKIITVCSACHNVLKRVNEDLKNDENFAFKVNNYVKPEVPYSGNVEVIHFLEYLRDEIGFDNLKKMVVNSFKGKKIAAFYGCLLLRPGKVMAMDDPENPQIIEDFIKAIGGTPVIYAMRNECCGGYTVLEDEKIAMDRSKLIIDNAKDMGADFMVTACPLCMYNLNKTHGDLPVHYFTELLAEALGVKED